MHNPLVKIEGLSHKYTENWAIRDINLEIDSKGIVGLLGSNGAGKSTTMNILCGALNPTEGKVVIDGIDMRENPEEAKRLIGFMPQYPPLYLDLTVEEYLTHCAHLRLIEKGNIKKAVNDAMERCKIPHFRNRLLSNLSGGYRQRVSIAQSIIHLPKLVVLDEPNTGLDPNQVIELRALIKDLASERAVILSSHVLSEVQLLCHNIRMIEHGRIVFADTMDAFNNYIEPHSILMTMENPPKSEELLAIEGVSSAEFLTEKQIRLFFNGNTEISERIIETCVHNKWRLREINLEKTSLTEVFAHLSNHRKN
ncbi:ABC transporter ATP-binding protein [Solitalea lacus]|uniref:ABC transporter ATP-binding protein n=1 Tax=Solitalea lacus TaxID=2911172 RepID=UPI001EDA38A0|nr:ABC transporter ATP-binding protein [Solitalea lacus]UKJ06761.1 ABC transporter ATP-binding protein [Solitalea lacus]